MSAFGGKADMVECVHVPVFFFVAFNALAHPTLTSSFMLLETGNYFAVARSNARAESLGVGLTERKGGFE
jgi:hypothetical protein